MSLVQIKEENKKWVLLNVKQGFNGGDSGAVE